MTQKEHLGRALEAAKKIQKCHTDITKLHRKIAESHETLAVVHKAHVDHLSALADAGDGEPVGADKVSKAFFDRLYMHELPAEADVSSLFK